MRSSAISPRVIAAIATACGALAAHSGIAEAAVRTCGARIESAIMSAPTELEAKKRALDDWRAKATVLGPGFDGWHVAAEKVLQCFAKDGHYDCMAVGNPCVIQQNPNQKPAGKDRKGEPL